LKKEVEATLPATHHVMLVFFLKSPVEIRVKIHPRTSQNATVRLAIAGKSHQGLFALAHFKRCQA
jgi:hypothetical protein